MIQKLLTVTKLLIKKIGQFYFDTVKYVLQIIGAAIITGVIMIPIAYLSAWALGVNPGSGGAPPIPVEFQSIKGLIGVCLMIGILEETMYRYLLQDCLFTKRFKLPFWVAISIASVLFGIAHFGNAEVLGIPIIEVAPQVIAASLAGSWFGYLYKRFGLHFVIFTHGLYDFIVLCMMYYL